MNEVVSTSGASRICCYCGKETDISGNGCECKFCADCYIAGDVGVICVRCGFCSECSGCGFGCGEDCFGVEMLGVSTAYAPMELPADRREWRREAHDFVLVTGWEADAMISNDRSLKRIEPKGSYVYYRCSACGNVHRQHAVFESMPNPKMVFQGEVEPDMVHLPGGWYKATYTTGVVQLLDAEYLRRVEGHGDPSYNPGVEVFDGLVRRYHRFPSVEYKLAEADASLVSR